MEWFRHSDLAEMREELETGNNLQLLSKISNEKSGTFQAATWTDWFERWRACPMEEKNRLLRDIFAIYRKFSDFGWWCVWILMFIEELCGLSRYFRTRLKSHDERWSLIVWSFFEVMSGLKYDLNHCVSIISICEQTKRNINRSIYVERKIRRLETTMPELDTFPDVRSFREREETFSFALLCRSVERFTNNLFDVDRTIIEEICILGRSGESCALRLKMNRQQVNRRLVHIKTKLSDILKIPAMKRIKKN